MPAFHSRLALPCIAFLGFVSVGACANVLALLCRFALDPEPPDLREYPDQRQCLYRELK